MSSVDVVDLTAGPDVPDGSDGRDTAEKYYLELTGQVIDDQDPDEVAERLARLLRIPLDHARRLLQGRTYRIRRELDLAKAEHLLSKLTARGVGAIIEPVERRSNPSAPSLRAVGAPAPVSTTRESTAVDESSRPEEVLDYELDIEISAPTPFALVTGDGDQDSLEASVAPTPETSEEARGLGEILAGLQARKDTGAESPSDDSDKAVSEATSEAGVSMSEDVDTSLPQAKALSLVDPAPEPETPAGEMDRSLDGEEIEIEVMSPTAGFSAVATGVTGEGNAPEPPELSLEEPPAPNDDAVASDAVDSAGRTEVEDLDLTLVLSPQAAVGEALSQVESPAAEQDDEATRPMEAVSPEDLDADEHVVLEMPAALSDAANVASAAEAEATTTAGWRARLATVDRRIGYAAVGALLLAGAGWAAMQFLLPASPSVPVRAAATQPAPVDPALVATRQRQLALVRSVKVWMIEFGAGFDPAQVTMQRLQKDLKLDDAAMRDGWGTAFRYRPGDGEYLLASAGPDRRFDTDDDLVRTVRMP